MCRRMPPGADPVRTVPAAATAAVRTGAALDPSLTDIRAVEAAAAEAEGAVRTFPDAAGAGIRRGIADRDAHPPIDGIGAWAAQGAEMVRRRLGIAKARKGPCPRTCREAIMPDNHLTFSARAPAAPT